MTMEKAVAGLVEDPWKVAKFGTATLGTIAVIAGNISYLSDLSDRIMGYGDPKLQIAVFTAKEKQGDDDVEIFTIQFSARKERGVISRNCNLVSTSGPRIHQESEDFDLGRNDTSVVRDLDFRVNTNSNGKAINSDEREVDDEILSKNDGRLQLKGSVILSCDGAISNEVKIQIPARA